MLRRQPRKVLTLEEEFERLRLLQKAPDARALHESLGAVFPGKPEPIEEAKAEEQDEPEDSKEESDDEEEKAEESAKAEASDDEADEETDDDEADLDEGARRQRIKPLRGAERAKAKAYRRKNRSKIRIGKKRYAKKASTKRQQKVKKRVQKRYGGKSPVAGKSRMRMQYTDTGAFANMAEGLLGFIRDVGGLGDDVSEEITAYASLAKAAKNLSLKVAEEADNVPSFISASESLDSLAEMSASIAEGIMGGKVSKAEAQEAFEEAVGAFNDALKWFLKAQKIREEISAAAKVAHTKAEASEGEDEEEGQEGNA